MIKQRKIDLLFISSFLFLIIGIVFFQSIVGGILLIISGIIGIYFIICEVSHAWKNKRWGMVVLMLLSFVIPFFGISSIVYYIKYYRKEI